MKWLLIAIIVGATTVGEVLQALGMRRHGEIRDFRPGALGRAVERVSWVRWAGASLVVWGVALVSL